MNTPLGYVCRTVTASALVVASAVVGSPRQAPRATTDCSRAVAGFGLEVSLQNRLALFVAAQRDSDWQSLEKLVTSVVEGSDGGHVRISPEVRSRILAQLKERPLVGFAPTSQIQPTSELSHPTGQRLWQIHGCATYREAGHIRNSKGIIWAYSNMGEWLFGFVLLAPRGKGRTIDE